MRLCESTEARLNNNHRIWKWLGRTDRPRAQRRHPPPVAGMGARAFNAPAMFSPNPVTRNVIGSKHPSNPHFSQLHPPDKQEYNQAQCDSRYVISRCPSRHPESAHRSKKSYVVPDPRANTFLPREESDNESQHLNRSGCDYCHDVQACPRLSQSEDDVQEPNSEACAIITKVPSNKTARGHAGTEASSRSAHRAPIEPYSIAYAM